MFKRQWAALVIVGVCVGSTPAAPAHRKPATGRRLVRAAHRAGPRAAVPTVPRARQQFRRHVERGFELYELRQFSGAVCQFRQASCLEPRDSSLRATLGDLYANQRALAQAAAAYRNAIRLAPCDLSLYERLGITYERLDQPQLAASVYKNVIWIDACDATAHQHLGWALERQGQREDALLAYQRALQLDPDNPIARARLNRLQSQMPPSQIVRRAPTSRRRRQG